MPQVGSCTERHWHILKPVMGESVPTKCLFFQIEPRVREVTHRVREHTFRVGAGLACWLHEGEVMDEEWMVFRSSKDWRQWVRAHRCRDRATWVYAYGLAYCLLLLDHLRSLNLGDEHYVSGILSDPPTILLTRIAGRLVRYVDVKNYWRVPLRELAPDLWDGQGTRPPEDAPDIDHLEWCKRKVRVIRDCICSAVSLCRAHHLGAWQCTAASLSFGAYRHSFIGLPIRIHADPDAARLERDAYFGGRLECWASGHQTQAVSIYDFNSLYPAVMRDYLHPISLVSYVENPSVQELRQALRGYWCVAEVSLWAGGRGYPVHDGKLVSYGRDDGNYCLPDPELRQAVAACSVYRVSRLARYHAGSPFTGFIDYFYPLKVKAKAEGKHAECLFWKLLLNSLYGKFAQKKKEWVDVQEKVNLGKWAYWWGRDPATGTVALCRSIAGAVQVYREGGECRHSLCALSASITSAARVELARAIATAGQESVHYTDTDSVHCRAGGAKLLELAGLIDGGAIGSLKHVTTGHDAYYWGPKHYRVGDLYCCNFLTATTREIAEGRYLQESKQGLEHSIMSGVLDRVVVKDRKVTITSGNGCYSTTAPLSLPVAAPR